MLLPKLFKKALASPSIRLLSIIGIAIVGFGATFYHFQEGLSWLDAVYFTVITLTTVGYGDFSPQTPAGKVFTIGYILIGLGVFAAFIGMVSSLTMELVAEEEEARRK